MDKFLAWIRQPTTLIGLALGAGAFSGDYFGSITEQLAYTIAAAAIPLLLPDNTSLQGKASLGASVVLQEIAKHGAIAGAAAGAAVAAASASPTTETASHE